MTVHQFPSQPSKSKHGLITTETRLTVGDEEYRVRRSVDPDGDGGFQMFFDSTNAAILVCPASIPAELSSAMIIAWRAGFSYGRAKGRQESIISIVPEQGQ